MVLEVTLCTFCHLLEGYRRPRKREIRSVAMYNNIDFVAILKGNAGTLKKRAS